MWKCIAGVACVLFSAAAVAGERGSWSDLESSPSFGLYLHKSFGGHQDRSSLTFGFQMHAEASGLMNDASGVRQPWRSMPLVDVQFNGAGNHVTRFYGVSPFDSSDIGTLESLDNPWFWVIVAVTGGGVACLAEWGICQGSGGHRYNTNPTPTPTGASQ